MPEELRPDQPEFFMGFEAERINEKSHRHLPQWRQANATYFVTFRLLDSLPTHLLNEWKTNKSLWLEQNPKPWDAAQRRYYQINFSQKIAHWLDQGMGSCLLKLEANRNCLIQSLNLRDGIDYYLGDWVIMPNHVHLLVRPLGDSSLSQILQTWKGVSAHRVNQRLGRTGSLWMDESFTHIIRNLTKLKKASEYIHSNPTKAKLKAADYTLSKGKAAWFCGDA